MTFAGFFVHLESIPPVLRWLQWLCPLKFMLEALSVNEVGSGLMISVRLTTIGLDCILMHEITGYFARGTGQYIGNGHS